MHSHTHAHDKRYTNFYPSIYAQQHTLIITHTLFLLLSSALSSFFSSFFVSHSLCLCAFNRTVTLLLLFLFSLQTFKRNFTDRRWWAVCMHACLLACCAFQMSARGKEKETKNVQNPKMVFYLFSFVFALPNGRIDHNYYYYGMRYVCVYVVFVFSSSLFFFTRPTI